MAIRGSPCRGRYFLMPIRKYPKNRLKGGAEILLPQEQAPSLKNPTRSAFIDSAHNVSGIEIKPPDAFASGVIFYLSGNSRESDR